MAMSDFVATHKGLLLGGGVLVALVIGGQLLKKTTTTPATASNSNLGGLTNGLVYVPTSTSFTTDITNKGNYAGASNVGNTSTSTSTSTSTNTTTTTVNPPPRVPPPPQPPPPDRDKHLIWDARHTIVGGETLSSIAASLTRQLRAAGMPGSQSVSWHQLYAHNTGVINEEAAKHHGNTKKKKDRNGRDVDTGENDGGGPWNHVFPGETIIVPRWGI